MKRKDIIFVLLIIVILFGSNFLFRYDSKVSTIFKKNVFANGSCIITGSSYSNADALSVKATGKDATSGIDTWYCYNINNRSWSVCNNSTSCSSMTFSGWNYITKVKVTDKAGNTSSEKNLYDYYDAVYSGSRTNSSSFTISDNDYYNAVHIDTYSASTGTITNVDVKDSSSRDSLIYVTGYPEEKETTYTTTTYNAASRTKSKYDASKKEKTYICKTGKPVKKGNSYVCESDDYRLQNETCTCVFKKDGNKYVKDTEWKNASLYDFSCARVQTFCNDDYDTDLSDDELFEIITSDTSTSSNTKCDQAKDGIGCYSSSNLYDRPNSSGDLCFTYYKTDYYGNVFYTNFIGTSFMNYTDFQSQALRLNVSPGIKKLLLDESKNDNPCSRKNDSNIITSTLLTDSGGLCDILLSKLNQGESINKYGMADDRYLVPVTSSASCLFNQSGGTIKAYESKAPNSNAIEVDDTYYYCSNGSKPVNNNGTYKCSSSKPNSNAIEYNGYYYYCSDNSVPVFRNSTYQCAKQTQATITSYVYDWTVFYYEK